MKFDFKPFKVGTVFNPIQCKVRNNYPVLENVEILFPSRLNAMAIDPSKIAVNNNLVYTPGEVVFSVKLYNKIAVKVTSSGKCEISENSKRKSLIRHSFEIMKKAIGFKNGLYIDVSNDGEIKHAGLGSSSKLLAGVASAINEIYGCPIDRGVLVKYLAQNHGEEIEGVEDVINPVQCIGGSAASGLFEGGILILAGESMVIGKAKIDPKYKVIIGIPKDFKPVDSRKALEIELEHIDGFIQCGKKYGPKIAYSILHKLFPAMVEGNLEGIGDVIYDYRFNMGSIKNCSCLYPRLVELTNNLSYLKKKKYVDVLTVSSIGPGVFAITKNPRVCLKAFKKEGLEVYTTEIENDSYRVLSRITREEIFWGNNVKFFSERSPCPLVKEILSKIKNKQKLLDLGCGGGRNTVLAAELGFDIYCIDPNEEMLNQTKLKLKKFYDGKELEKRIQKGSVFDLPYGNESFDVVICTGVFHQTKSKRMYEKAIKETSRILKKNGILITNIFTNRLIDKSLNKIGKNLFITKEGLYMTLLSKEQFLSLCKKYGLKKKGKIVEYNKDIGTGLRNVLKISFEKK